MEYMHSLDHIADEHGPARDVRPSIMAVDDDAGTVKAILKILLRLPGYKVSGFVRSEKAMDVILGESPPNIVLLDINLAGDDINGIELLKKIKAGGFDGTVCMLSADDSSTRVLEALLAGANEYLAKPVENLLEEVKIIIENRLAAERGELSLGRTRFLDAKGLFPDQLELLETYRANGYPDLPRLSKLTGISTSALSDRFLRIRERLNVENMAQLAALLTALSGYGTRQQIVNRSADNE